MKTLLTFILIILLSFRAYGQVEFIETGTKSIISQIKKKDGVVFISGNYNFFKKCYNECDSLITLAVAGPEGYWNTSLNVIDTNTLFILSYFGLDHSIIYKSTNGGKGWEKKLDSVNLVIDNVKMFDTLEGVILSTRYRLLRTVDGGNEWELGSYPYPTVSAVEIFNDSLIAIGINESFCISTNRGKAWECDYFVQNSPRRIFFLNKDTILITFKGEFAYSFDRGKKWTHNALPLDAYGLHFFNVDEGYVVGGSGRIFKTTDLGNTWSVYEVQGANTLIDIKFLNDSIALISGTNGVLFKWNKNSLKSASIEEDVKKTSTISLSPNPSENEQTLKIATAKPEMMNIQLCDLSGRLVTTVYSGMSKGGEMSFSVNLSSLERGVYLYRINIGTEQYFYKAVKL